MPDTIHSEKCIADQKRWREAVETYNRRWPNHCKACHGWGVTGSAREDYDTGMIDIDPCDDCEQSDQCPRCGAHTFDWSGAGGITKCADCLFDIDCPEGEPQEPECGCYMLPENDPLT